MCEGGTLNVSLCACLYECLCACLRACCVRECYTLSSSWYFMILWTGLMRRSLICSLWPSCCLTSCRASGRKQPDSTSVSSPHHAGHWHSKHTSWETTQLYLLPMKQKWWWWVSEDGTPLWLSITHEMFEGFSLTCGFNTRPEQANNTD